MKYYRKTALLLLLIALMLNICGCRSKLSEPEKDIVTLNYKLEEDERLRPLYASETRIYAAVNKRKPPHMSAPGFTATTEQFIVYDLQSQKVVAKYDPGANGTCIFNAVPFKKGILYAAYTPLGPDDSLDESIKWDIKYISDEGSKIIDSGRCSSMVDKLPEFTVLDGEVYYLYEDLDEDTGYGFGIKRADLGGPEIVVEEKGRKLIETQFQSNGKDYAVLTDGKFLVGNAKGFYREYDLPKPMSDYGICRDYLFCCTESDGNRWTARSISLKTGEEYTAEIEKPLFRIASMGGDELTCIDTNFDMYILRPGKEFEIVSLENPKEIREGRDNVGYYPYGDTKTFAQLKDTKLCRIVW